MAPAPAPSIMLPASARLRVKIADGVTSGLRPTSAARGRAAGRCSGVGALVAGA